MWTHGSDVVAVIPMSFSELSMVFVEPVASAMTKYLQVILGVHRVGLSGCSAE